MRSLLCTLLAVGWLPLAALPASSQEAADRKAVPDAAAQAQAEKLIRDVFKDEYARTSAADRLDLARKLLQQGIDTVDDPASRFVLFREARDLAAQAGDIETALAAVDEMARFFQVSAPETKNVALSTLARTAKDPEACKRLAAAFLQTVDDAIVSDDYVAASSAADSAGALARRAKDLPLAAKADAKTKEIADMKGRYEASRKARETLAAAPQDPAANLTLGRFLCFVKGRWEEGLPYLAKGSDDGLKALAAGDLAQPAAPSEQVTAGDGWWDLAEKENGLIRENLRKRAGHWYEKAVEGLSGLTRRRIEKRLTELPPSEAAASPGAWRRHIGKADEFLDTQGTAEERLAAYAKAREQYQKAFSCLPPGLKPSPADQELLMLARYNYACTISMTSAKKAGEERKADVDLFLSVLRQSLEDGFAKFACRCRVKQDQHPGVEHLLHDPDLEPLRDEPRLLKLAEEFRP